MSQRVIVPPRDSNAPVKVPQATPKDGGKKPSGIFNERHTAAQDPLYQQWIDEKTPLTLMFDDGSTIEAQLMAYDTYAVQAQVAEGTPMLIFKQALRWIKPT